MTAAEKTRLLAELVHWDGARCFEPLTNLAHAGEVLEAMAKKGWSARIATNALSSDQNGCEFFRDYLGLGNNIFSGNYAKYGADKRVCAVAPTIPTAICHAALLANGVKEEEL